MRKSIILESESTEPSQYYLLDINCREDSYYRCNCRKKIILGSVIKGEKVELFIEETMQKYGLLIILNHKEEIYFLKLQNFVYENGVEVFVIVD